MEKKKSIIVWCFSIYSILAGIFSNTFTVSNILFILAGLCIMPPIVKKVTEKTTKYSKKVKWFVFIILTLLAYSTYPANNNVEVNSNVSQEQNIMENYTLNDEMLEIDSSVKEQSQKEEQVEKEVEDQAEKETEEQSKKEAQDQAKKEAEEQSKKEAQNQAKKKAEEQSKKEEQDQAKKEAEEQSKKENESQTNKDAERHNPTVTVPAPETGSNLVWIPTNGGKKYHSHSGCSNMKNPNQVTKATAEANGFTPCAKCY